MDITRLNVSNPTNARQRSRSIASGREPALPATFAFSDVIGGENGLPSGDDFAVRIGESRQPTACDQHRPKHHVHEFSPDLLSASFPGLNDANGVAVDNAGFVYVTDNHDNKVLKLTAC